MFSVTRKTLATMLLVLFSLCAVSSERPNIILIMTDDQGYGDIGRYQNPAVSTPNLDSLANESVRFTNFHMDPTCSPSRSALMTGKHSMRAGVWHTIMGRSLLPTQHTTIAEAFQQGGYKTAMFGKWHLGDNYPFRPQDQGFDEVLIHGGGGVGQTPDYWGNTQFEDSYFHNGKPEHFDKFATTVWFDGAIDFINQTKDQPFFAYISTNAPHSPWRAPDEYVKPYIEMGLPKNLALYYAMITQLDEQVGRLRIELEKAGVAENTLLVFTTDNGSTMSGNHTGVGKGKFNQFFKDITKRPELSGWVYNAGMRDFKSSVYEGGHRVPLFVHWPKGDLTEGRDQITLAAHFDLMPTLLDAAGIAAPKNLDGVSLMSVLNQKADIKDREIIVTNQRVDIPNSQRPSVVMTDRWRYVMHGEDDLIELFDIQADPGQTTDIKLEYPVVAKKLQASFDSWWTSVTADGFPRQRIIVGNSHENPVRLTSMDWMEAKLNKQVPWFPGFYRPKDNRIGPGWIGREHTFKSLPWYLQVDSSGSYKVTLYVRDKVASHQIGRKYATLEVDGKRHVVEVKRSAAGVEFELTLNKGPISMRGWFSDNAKSEDEALPAFFAYVQRLDKI